MCGVGVTILIPKRLLFGRLGLENLLHIQEEVMEAAE